MSKINKKQNKDKLKYYKDQIEILKHECFQAIHSNEIFRKENKRLSEIVKSQRIEINLRKRSLFYYLKKYIIIQVYLFFNKTKKGS